MTTRDDGDWWVRLDADTPEWVIDQIVEASVRDCVAAVRAQCAAYGDDLTAEQTARALAVTEVIARRKARTEIAKGLRRLVH